MPRKSHHFRGAGTGLTKPGDEQLPRQRLADAPVLLQEGVLLARDADTARRRIAVVAIAEVRAPGVLVAPPKYRHCTADASCGVPWCRRALPPNSSTKLRPIQPDHPARRAGDMFCPGRRGQAAQRRVTSRGCAWQSDRQVRRRVKRVSTVGMGRLDDDMAAGGDLGGAEGAAGPILRAAISASVALDAHDRELSGVGADADIDESGIGSNVVESHRHRLAEFGNGEVMHLDRLRLARGPQLTAAVPEVPVGGRGRSVESPFRPLPPAPSLKGRGRLCPNTNPRIR